MSIIVLLEALSMYKFGLVLSFISHPFYHAATHPWGERHAWGEQGGRGGCVSATKNAWISSCHFVERKNFPLKLCSYWFNIQKHYQKLCSYFFQFDLEIFFIRRSRGERGVWGEWREGGVCPYIELYTLAYFLHGIVSLDQQFSMVQMV